MTTDRRLARTAGILFLLTFVSAIAGVAFYGPLLADPAAFVRGEGSAVSVLLGVLCELVLIGANVGTALALYPVLRRDGIALALAYVVARVVECVFIAVGVLAVLTVVALRREAGIADAVNAPGGPAADGGFDSALPLLAEAFVALRDWTFLLGPGFVVGLGNGLLLGWLFWRSRRIPRGLALVGMVGGPLMTLSGVAVLFGAYGQGSLPSALATLPEIVWEASLGLYLAIRGFRAAPDPDAAAPEGDQDEAMIAVAAAAPITP